ncbi:MAG: tRNA preQ1(34) S-adenosylmethionine ribosyltransferase-isomerase QueA [Lentisphaerae bacterium GWF2_45_14]|nr:MAG: tRNA preQ1(34) S-adenosylmethionine ribosyltransferase-isomerase QueA [Lentisphaerae bacterium GWF2_45_14]
MLTANFDYNLPEELIAQYPLPDREGARMLVLDRKSGSCEMGEFRNISEFLREKDCAVFNDTKVIRSRIFGRKDSVSGARVEILLISKSLDSNDSWQSLLRPRKRVRPGTHVFPEKSDGSLMEDCFLSISSLNDDGSCTIAFDGGASSSRIIEECGHVPLPPYIKRKDALEDIKNYQTIFAKEPGAVAAPTAGLHFTPAILNGIRLKGVSTTEVTLHVGPGTFKPVSAENIKDHQMHSEDFLINEDAARLINQTREAGKKVFAVGTTTVRVLETMSSPEGILKAGSGSTDIFIYPPYQPKTVDMLLTNFHLPKSTLLMLVCAFAGQNNVMKAYELAIREKFRFYSYGDCMLLI